MINPKLLNDCNLIEQSIRETTRILDFAKTYEELGAEKLVNINVKNAIDEAKGMFLSYHLNSLTTVKV